MLKLKTRKTSPWRPTLKLYNACLVAFIAALGLSGCGIDVTSIPFEGRGSLNVGDPAPPISIDEWFQGEGLDSLETGKVHVIEFWATWCGPCLQNMPHLSELQTQYADEAIFIGVTDETAEKVSTFLAGEASSGQPWSEVITYRLGTDLNENMYRNYMAAANRMSLPSAFVVGKQGKITWIGHPADIDAPLQAAIAAES